MGCNPVSMVDPLGLAYEQPRWLGMGQPTARDIAYMIPPTLLLDGLYGFNNDPWMDNNRAVVDRFLEAISGGKKKSERSFRAGTGDFQGLIKDGILTEGSSIDEIDILNNFISFKKADGSYVNAVLDYEAQFDKEDDIWTEMDSWMKPAGIPLSGIEYQLGKSLAASDANDMIKRFNENTMLKNNSYLRTRPVNVHLPGGVRVEIPRNAIKNISTGLKAFGVASAVVGGVNDINKFNRGEISGAHLTVNLIMSGVGFIGPWGAGISIVYSLVEDHIW